MGRKKGGPFKRNMKFNGKVFSYHSIQHGLKLAKTKAETLRNKGLLARVHKLKSSTGGYIYAVYERLPKRKHRKRGYTY